MRLPASAKKNQTSGLDDPVLERDICLLTKRYLKGDAILDISANIPGLIYIIYLGPKADSSELSHLYDDYIFVTLMALKILRLAHYDEVQDAFERLFSKLGDIFYLSRYMFNNLKSWFLTCLKFVFSVHYFACGWVIIELVKDLNEVRRLDFVEESVVGRYFESFYLITTTITTVGYGDYKAYNDNEPVWAVEMCYLYFVTLTGIILFSSVTN